MIPLAPPFRLATRDDAAALADLVNFAGDGLPEHLWRQMAGPGEDPWEIGRARQASKAESAGIVVVDAGAGVLAALTGYPIGTEPEPVDELPPLVRPLQELENLALDSWYVNVLAAYPEARGKGHGGRLLELAEAIARDLGCARMSVIVSDANPGARRLYERHGYAETARRPMVKDGWTGPGTDWVLMLKAL